MERIHEKGEDQIRQDIKTIWIILGKMKMKRKEPMATLDGLKQKSNVFRKFIFDNSDL
jgi:hypothetical protein